VGRAKNQLETVQLTIAATPQMIGYLRQLAGTGLFGKNPSETAERLLARALEERLRQGEISAQDANT
jgi:predicted kinase